MVTRHESVIRTIRDKLLVFEKLDGFDERVREATEIFEQVVEHFELFAPHDKLIFTVGLRAMAFLHQPNLREQYGLLNTCRRLIQRMEDECPEMAYVLSQIDMYETE